MWLVSYWAIFSVSFDVNLIMWLAACFGIIRMSCHMIGCLLWNAQNVLSCDWLLALEYSECPLMWLAACFGLLRMSCHVIGCLLWNNQTTQTIGSCDWLIALIWKAQCILPCDWLIVLGMISESGHVIGCLLCNIPRELGCVVGWSIAVAQFINK